MNPIRSRICHALLATTLSLAGPVALAAPPGSAFTYQGRLADGGQSVHGSADLRFTLYDAASGGAVVGAPLEFVEVPLLDGVFTVEMDFGAQAIGREARWVEVEVRFSASDPFVTLSPRQPLTAAPVSWFAMRPWAPNDGHYYLSLAEDAGQSQRGVGIAVATPEARLHVRQAPFSPAEPAVRIEDAFARSQLLIETPESAGRAALQAWNGQTNTAGNLSLNVDGGNVGIGKADPLAKLDVDGPIQADYLTLGTSVPDFGLFVSDSGVDTFGTNPLLLQSFTGGIVKATSGFEVAGTSTFNGQVDITGDQTVGGDLTVGDELNVTGPFSTNDLDVNGKLTLGGRVALDALPTRVDFELFTGLYDIPALELNNSSGGSVAMAFNGVNADWMVGHTPDPARGGSGDFFVFESNFNENRLLIERGGSHAGITLNGNVTVTRDLTVTGDVHMDGIEVTAFGQVLIAGFPDPQAAGGGLFVQGDAYLSRGADLRFYDSHGGTSTGIVTNLEDDLELWADGRWRVRVYEENNRSVLRTQMVDADVLVLRGGADIAEPFNVNHGAAANDGPQAAAAGAIEPGMVVAIDPDHPGELRIASAAYDNTVAGIISGAGGVNPGLMLQQEGTIADGEHPVALSGRVYVYVDADANGAVVPGDMLTTSATPGHAMKATDRERSFGAVIGKAMSGRASGRGLVLVLVNLQ